MGTIELKPTKEDIKQAKRIEAELQGLKKNIGTTEEFIRTRGSEVSDDKLQVAKNHLHDLITTTRERTREYNQLMNAEPVQMIFF